MKIPVFYNKKQTATSNNSFSPSAGKPAKVVDDWKEKFGDRIEIRNDFNPAHIEELSWVHDRDYVQRVMTLTEANGFGNRLPEVRDALPWVSGSMSAATRWAVWQSNKGNPAVAFSPTSGAHHAGYNFGGGFCTFNFIALAASIAMSMGKNKIGILDFDAHYGDGTQNIIDFKNWNKSVYQLGTNDYAYSLLSPTEFFENIHKSIPDDTDFIIYNAGADAHIDDPLGGDFTTKELEIRDKQIFQVAKDRGISVVVSLAGGYQNINNVVRIHRNTMEKAIEIFGGIDHG